MKEKHYITRKEQAVLTKKKIFDTTIFLIRKKGYSKITIREICQNAEISVGTFYL
ncbi:TetR/AcrR family transcriptional regulator, partial [Sellimonas intestinalis]